MVGTLTRRAATVLGFALLVVLAVAMGLFSPGPAETPQPGVTASAVPPRAPSPSDGANKIHIWAGFNVTVAQIGITLKGEAFSTYGAGANTVFKPSKPLAFYRSKERRPITVDLRKRGTITMTATITGGPGQRIECRIYNAEITEPPLAENKVFVGESGGSASATCVWSTPAGPA